jgi:hypothetical protein
MEVITLCYSKGLLATSCAVQERDTSSAASQGVSSMSLLKKKQCRGSNVGKNVTIQP